MSLIGALEPDLVNDNRFLQIYFIDVEAAASRRVRLTEGLKHDIILLFQDMLHEHNKYVRELKSAYEFAKTNFPTYCIVINENARPVGGHKRQFNAPTLDEVAILMPNDSVGHCDIVLKSRSDGLQKLNEMCKAYDPLQYPLLHVFGSDGWSLQMKFIKIHIQYLNDHIIYVEQFFKMYFVLSQH